MWMFGEWDNDSERSLGPFKEGFIEKENIRLLSNKKFNTEEEAWDWWVEEGQERYNNQNNCIDWNWKKKVEGRKKSSAEYLLDKGFISAVSTNRLYFNSNVRKALDILYSDIEDKYFKIGIDYFNKKIIFKIVNDDSYISLHDENNQLLESDLVFEIKNMIGDWKSSSKRFPVKYNDKYDYLIMELKGEDNNEE